MLQLKTQTRRRSVIALTHEEMRARLARGNAEGYRWAEKELKKAIPASELPLPPAQFVRVVHALTEGLFALRFLTPELITEEVIVAAFEALAPAKTRKLSEPSALSQERRRRKR